MFVKPSCNAQEFAITVNKLVFATIHCVFWKYHTEAVATTFISFLDFFWCRRTLLEFGILAEFTGQQLIDSFSNDKLGESSLVDFVVHCMRHDDIVHKLDSFGYRVFLTTGFYVSLFVFSTVRFFNTIQQPVETTTFFVVTDVVFVLVGFFLPPCLQWNINFCDAVLNEDKSETEEFKVVWNHLMTECINYDLSRAKLVSRHLFSQIQSVFLVTFFKVAIINEFCNHTSTLDVINTLIIFFVPPALLFFCTRFLSPSMTQDITLFIVSTSCIIALMCWTRTTTS
jgi:hypothetical protein